MNACHMFNLVFEFQRQLRLASLKDKGRATLQKQNSQSTANSSVLRRDLSYILSLMDKALVINNIGFLRPVLFLNMEG